VELESEKPEGKAGPESERGKTPAEDRVDALISGKDKSAADAADKPEPGQASLRMQEKKRAEQGGKPVLTEKQRIEARQKRQARKRRPVKGNAISSGLRATTNEVKRTALFLGRGVLGALDGIKPLGGIIVRGFVGLLRAIGRGFVFLAGLVAVAFKALGRVVLALDRVVTARRGLILIAVAAAALLIVSQFLDFRAIEIGQPGYVDVQEITHAPRVESQTPIDSHSFLLLATGALALVAAIGAALSSRRVIGLALMATGAVTLLVALIIDLPAGLDAADAELAFSGVKAILLSGFWLEVGAGAVLAVSGLALFLESPAPRKVRSRERRPVNSPVTGSRA
jgi:hypothetical protein